MASQLSAPTFVLIRLLLDPHILRSQMYQRVEQVTLIITSNMGTHSLRPAALGIQCVYICNSRPTSIGIEMLVAGACYI